MEGSLDPYTPHIGLPEGLPKNPAAAQDLPYYFAIIHSIKAAEVCAGQSCGSLSGSAVLSSK